MTQLGSLVEPWARSVDAILFVWGLWALLTLFMIHEVKSFSVNVPWMDEWEMVPALTGHQPISLQWLWSQHNEHRIFLPRLIYLALVKLSGDFRAGAYFNAMVLSASAAVMMWVARELRGFTSYWDAFFPIVALNFGQWENVVFSFHVNWIAASVLTTAVLLTIVQRGRLTFRAAAAMGACTVLLTLCGGSGLAFVPALVACVFLVGWQLRAARRPSLGPSLNLWLIGAVALGLTRWYFVAYERPLKHTARTDRGQTLNAAMQFLATGLGSSAKEAWPEVATAIFAASLTLFAGLVATWLMRPGERGRVHRILLFFGGIGSLAVGTAWARSALFADAMFSSRYATPAAAFWYATYLGWEIVPWRSLRRVFQASLFFLAAGFWQANRSEGMKEAAMQFVRRTALVQDIQQGVSLEDIVARHAGSVYYGEHLAVAPDHPAGPATLRMDLRMLKASRFGIFRNLKE
jgi:hypothetical protein